jgi:hypothetical protein
VTRFASEANVHRRENDYGQEKIAKKKHSTSQRSSPNLWQLHQETDGKLLIFENPTSRVISLQPTIMNVA